MASRREFFICFMFLIITTVYSEVRLREEGNEPVARDDIRYIPTNCADSEPTIHEPVCPSADEGWCYHIDIYRLTYPDGGFCILEDPLHGLEPGVIEYSVSVQSHTHYIKAGHGMYFNYQDANNYDVVYKIDMDSSICVVGYVENGQIHNTTTHACDNIGSSVWVNFKLDVNDKEATFTLVNLETATESSFSIEPHFEFSAKAGPLATNAFGNVHLHVQDILMDVQTCASDPTHPLCDGCNLAYNIQSLPEYPLPDSRNLLLWHPRALEMVYSACYLKVVVDMADKQQVRAVSKVGDFSHSDGDLNISPGDLYGERSQCTENQTVCVEVKYGGQVTDGDVVYDERSLAEVVLDSSLGLKAVEINPTLQLIYGTDIVKATSHEFHMYIREKVYGADFGIYCQSAQGSVNSAQTRAYQMCAAGSDNSLKPGDAGIIPNNWAVRFTA